MTIWILVLQVPRVHGVLEGVSRMESGSLISLVGKQPQKEMVTCLSLHS